MVLRKAVRRLAAGAMLGCVTIACNQAGAAEQTPSPAGGSAKMPDAGSMIRDCGACPEMVVVPSGRFVMGSPPDEMGRDEDEGPIRTVTIAGPVAIGRYEVTFDEWDACVLDGGCRAVKDDQGWGRGRRPVIHVDLAQAMGYAEWLSGKTGSVYRLLSEAEWEYAARAGSDSARFWGDSPDGACDFANVADERGGAAHAELTVVHDCNDAQAETSPAGTFAANAFGLHDMLGNVWELVADCYHSSYQGAPTDGSAWATGDCSLHVRRGGSWGDSPGDVRSAERGRISPTGRFNSVGFRVARELP